MARVVSVILLASTASAWVQPSRGPMRTRAAASRISTATTATAASEGDAAAGMTSRRGFGALIGAAALASSACVAAPRAALAANTPGAGVLGTWSCEQKGVEIETAELAFDKAGDVTLTPAKSTKTFEETYQEEEEVVDEDGNKSMKMKTKTRTVMKTEGKDPVLSASNWRVKDKELQFTLDYPEEVLTYKALLDDTFTNLIKGDIYSEGTKKVGSFTAKLLTAEGPDDMPKRASGLTYKPDEEPFDLQGQPRWKREREVLEEKRDARRAAAAAASGAPPPSGPFGLF